ncbi:1,2-phenylacetyl-CoA epoxidase subunit PaaD [Hoeflea prorocentri]|uniref:Phenylacetate-CoA oxygenase subunit PaaJ n=1 Tax=Hoeflea prorocentri TaxID=1922333 RepID=A0A9X3UHT7_9HYPH|nr:1,2-phenylacetyl-CoA epoxidase subunit PaaD [Hoeflea prorocentri]MCY6380705.1 phenylacetate-CoA oxygenase subunit PaaJ [Hoeflea prorocentri]MDA5398505.1 phenylacetate-CoA oxygenase subunit PaaJ [Hoeflea prorocentri]
MGDVADIKQQSGEGIRKAAWQAAAAVPDPEIPVVTVEDLGILRLVDLDAEGRVVAHVTPTYSGCPATQLIQEMVLEALQTAGFEDARVETVLSPAWTTDWISEAGRQKLKEYGIAPPEKTSNSKRALFGETLVQCPHCGAAETERVSEFGSTPCKALYRCLTCREPFDYFKCL